jgi:plastocyanin
VRRRCALAAAVATLAVAPAASAQGPVIEAVDGAPPGFDHTWAPTAVTVRAGTTVTWSFAATTAFHNVISRGTSWNYRSGEPARTPPPASFRFDTPGHYEFVCEVHGGMDGTVTVTDASGAPPPPPPPPPLSEQPFPNDAQPPPALEVMDEKRPRLERVRVRSVRDGARVRFRLSERARVSVRIKLAGLTVKSARRTFRAGVHRMTVRDRRMHGRYRVDVFARDLAGNRSRVRHARLTIR